MVSNGVHSLLQKEVQSIKSLISSRESKKTLTLDVILLLLGTLGNSMKWLYLLATACL
jgi:hypothetical protein